MNDKPKIYDRTGADLPINAVVSDVIVDDPLETGAKLKVMRSLRDDPLGRLHSRDQLRSPEETEADRKTGRNTGQARYEAGLIWLEYFEKAAIGNIRAIDTTKESVDGGELPDPLTETQRKAMKKLAEASRALGQDGEAILRDFLIGRLSMAQIATRRGYSERAGKEYIGRRVRECLERLAQHWGLTINGTRY